MRATGIRTEPAETADYYPVAAEHWQQDCVVSSVRMTRGQLRGDRLEYDIPPGIWITALTIGRFDVSVYDRCEHIEASDCVVLSNEAPVNVCYSNIATPTIGLTGAYFNRQWLRDVCFRHDAGDLIELLEGEEIRIRRHCTLCRLLGCMRAFARPPTSPRLHSMFREAKAIEVLSLLLDDLLPVSGVDVDMLTPREDRLLDQVLHLIDTQLARDLTSSTIAEQVGIGVRSLNDLLRRARGQSAAQLIQEQRLHRAYTLLSEDRVNVSTAAYEVGLTPNHLSTMFKDHFGFSPSDFKRKT